MTTTFDDERPIEHEIEIISDRILSGLSGIQRRIASLFPKAFNNYPQRIDGRIVYPPGETESSFAIRRNIQRTLADTVQALIHKFQSSQKVFLQRLIQFHILFFILVPHPSDFFFRNARLTWIFAFFFLIVI